MTEQRELGKALSDAGITFAEYAVLWHVRDTVVVKRDGLAFWVCHHLPNHVPKDIGLDDCLAAIDTLVRRGLLIELTDADIQGDLARWRAEPIPVSWGVDRRREVGDVDLTEAGFLVEESVARLTCPSQARTPAQGYNDEQADMIRVFGETEEACQRAAQHLVERIDQAPWCWSRSAIELEPVQAIGAWWVSRFERVTTGFELAVRRIA